MARIPHAFAVVAAAAAALSVTAAGAPAQDAAAFYRGRTVQAVVGYTPGSTFELYLRTFVQHMGRHVPGGPTIIVQHMPGAGSLKATGYLAGVAAADGSVIGMPNPVNTTEPLLDPQRTKFDPRKFAWLGSLNAETATCGFWARDINRFEDLRRRQIVLGSTGPASGSTVDAKVLAALFKLDVKIVTGYPGLTEVRLAAERGEVDGHCGLLVSAIKTDNWQAYKAGTLKVPLQMALRKHPDLPDVPNAYDLVSGEEDRQLFRLIFGPWSYGRPLMAPPATPPDRVATLRAAVQATLADPRFQADAKKINLEIQPVDPEAIAKTVDEIFRTPEPVLQRARELLGVKSR